MHQDHDDQANKGDQRHVSTVAVSMNCKVRIDYTNHRGERAARTIVPHNIWHGSTDHHPNPQWLLTAWDLDRKAMRVFAMQYIHSFTNESSNKATLRMNVSASTTPVEKRADPDRADRAAAPWAKPVPPSE